MTDNLPTKQEAIDRVASFFAWHDTDVRMSSRDIVDLVKSLEQIGVPFGPEPVVEPSDPLGVIVKDRTGKLWCWDDRDGHWKCSNSFIDLDWSRIPQPVVVFRRVDTPEPAPKYVAERIGSWLTVDGFSMASERIQLEAEIGRRQAALDLLDREERKTAEYDKSVKADGWEVS